MIIPAAADLRSRLATEAPQIARIIVAACISWQLCKWLGSTHPPIYAVVVPLVAMRDEPLSAFNVSFDRLVGVIAGICVGIGVVHWLGQSILAIALVLAVGLLIGVVLRVGSSLNVQIAVSGLLVFASTDPGSYVVARLWETAVGTVVTIVLSPLLLPPNARANVTRQLREVAAQLSVSITACAALAVAAEPSAEQAERLRRLGHDVQDRAHRLPPAVVAAQRAVSRNPLRRKDRRPLSELTPTAALAARLGDVVRVLTDEVSDLSRRPDLLPRWAELSAPLAEVLEPGAEAVLLALSPSGREPDSNPLDRALDAFERWRIADRQPISAVLRRPARRLLATLGRDPGVTDRDRAPDQWPSEAG